jgi:hypothetical protein
MNFNKQLKCILVGISIIVFYELLESSIIYNSIINKNMLPSISKKKHNVLEYFDNGDIDYGKMNEIKNEINEQEIGRKVEGFELNFFNEKNSYSLFGDYSYLQLMNPINIQSRGANSKAECIKMYLSNILKISDEEKESTLKFVEHLLYILSKSDIKYLDVFLETVLKTIYIAKNSNWLEQGLPHTHKNIVFLPQSWFNQINNVNYNKETGIEIGTENQSQSQSQNNKMIIELQDHTFLNASETFLHELVHIHQRIKSDDYYNFYKSIGFIEAKYIDNFENVLKMNRQNPDGMNLNWVWKDPYTNTYYWIGAVFNSENPSSLTDVNYIAFPLYPITDLTFKRVENSKNKILNEFDNFQKYFGIHNNNYHPAEIVAQYIEEYFNNSTLNNPAYNLFKLNLLPLLT